MKKVGQIIRGVIVTEETELRTKEKRKIYKVKCLKCGKEFNATGHQLTRKLYVCKCQRPKAEPKPLKYKRDADGYVVKVCKECGKQFKTTRANRELCGVDCTIVRRRRTATEFAKRNKGKPRIKEPVKPKETRQSKLIEVNTIARQQGLSYGQYKAMQALNQYARVKIDGNKRRV